MSMREPKTAPTPRVAKSAQEHREALGRILAIAVEKGYKIVAALDRIVITELLVSAVALIDRIE